jgi:hypothetical protein
MKCKAWVGGVMAIAWVASFGVVAAADSEFVAGTKPYQRPANAPRIGQMKKTAQWYAQALQGVSEPYPASLRFLEDQGAWYTPFNRPNVTGRYDIRGLYAAQKSQHGH